MWFYSLSFTHCIFLGTDRKEMPLKVFNWIELNVGTLYNGMGKDRVTDHRC